MDRGRLDEQPYEKDVFQEFHAWFNGASVMGVTNLLQPGGPPAQPGRAETLDAVNSDTLPSPVELPATVDSPLALPLSASDSAFPEKASGYFIPADSVEEHLNVTRLRKLLQALWPHEPPVQVETVQMHYRKVFCILLRMQIGRFIEHFVKHQSLRDHKLPFDTKPQNWPASADDFFPRFHRLQWMFCAHVFKHGEVNQQLSGYILPIIRKEDLPKGATAFTSRVQFHSAYNQLDPSGSNGEDTDKFFVIKTYCTRDAEEHYNNELSAYRRVRSSGNHSGGIVRFYGSFIHNGTHNLLLEYADRGTLNDFFETVSPPSTSQDINDFWKAMFSLTQAIFTIHNSPWQEGEPEDENRPTFIGWHQDVKPANILVTNGIRRSDFGCRIMLGDLGLCHFRSTSSKANRVLYGRQGSTHGDTYGTRVYGAPEAYRHNDFTGTSHMLVEQHVDIWSLGCIFSEAAVWVLQGKEHLREYRELRARETKQKGIVDVGCFHDGTGVLRCVEKTHEEALKSKRECDHITHNVLNMVDDMLDKEAFRLNAKQLLGKTDKMLKKAEATAKDWKRQATGSSRQSDPKTPPMSPIPSLIGRSGPSQSADPPTRHSTYASQESDSRGRQPYALGSGDLGYGSMDRCESPDRKTTMDDSQSLKLVGHEFGTASRPTLPEQPLRMPDVQQPNHPQALYAMRYPGSGRASTLSVPQRPPKRRNLSELKLEEVQHWIFQRKNYQKPLNQVMALGGAIAKNKPRPTLRNERLLDSLKNRDLVFLVDDSDSMKDHWTKVEILFGALSYMAKASDKDGMDLYFTRHEGEYNSSKTTDLADHIQGRKLDGPSNMEKSLSRILGKHANELLAGSKGRSLFGRKRPATPMNIYVFTDAAWHNRCDPSTPIQDFVNTLRERWDGKLPGDRSGIQFIRFGEDPEALACLQYLDTFLDPEDDIVDTEPCNGNVWKMLLGASNKTFDADLGATFTGRDTIDFSNASSFAKPQ